MVIDGRVVMIVHDTFDVFSVIWAIIMFSLMIAFALIMRKFKLITKYSVFPLFLMLLLCLVRIAVPIAIKGSINLIISNDRAPLLYGIITPIREFLRLELFEIFNFAVKSEHIITAVILLVAAALVCRYIIRCIKSARTVKAITALAERDTEAEEILFEADKRSKKADIKIYRTEAVKVPLVQGFVKGIILLPKLAFTKDELCEIIIHEWKHFRNGHMLISILSNLVCCIMWWNPLVYPWRNSVALALEMQCDYSAMTQKSKSKAAAYVMGIGKVAGCDVSSLAALHNSESASSFVTQENELKVRLIAMMEYKRPTKREKFMNIALCVCAVLIFAASYFFTIAYVPKSKPHGEGVIRAQYEQYLQENEDGTFSLWVDGQCLATSETVNKTLFDHFEQNGSIKYYED